jgi:hypothetical protein
MTKPIEQKTLWQSPDDDVTPMVVIEASMYRDEDYDPKDQEFDTPADREDYLARWRRDDFMGVGMEVEVSLYGVTIGEGSLWGIEHGQVSADTNADAWEISPAQFPEPNVVFMASPLSSVIVEALDVAADYLTRIEAGQAARDAVKAAQRWADPNNPESQQSPAERIAAEVNGWVEQSGSGRLAFRLDGTGGQHYIEDAVLPNNVVVVPIPDAPMSEADAQKLLDEWHAQKSEGTED